MWVNIPVPWILWAKQHFFASHPCHCVFCVSRFVRVVWLCVTLVTGAILSERCLSLDLNRKMCFFQVSSPSLSVRILRHSMLPSCFVGDVSRVLLWRGLSEVHSISSSNSPHQSTSHNHLTSDPTPSHHITSLHIKSHHIASHIRWHQITDHHMTWHRMTWHYITWHHITLSHFSPQPTTLPHLTTPRTNHITSSHLATMTSYHITSQHITWPPPTHHGSTTSYH